MTAYKTPRSQADAEFFAGLLEKRAAYIRANPERLGFWRHARRGLHDFPADQWYDKITFFLRIAP